MVRVGPGQVVNENMPGACDVGPLRGRVHVPAAVELVLVRVPSGGSVCCEVQVAFVVLQVTQVEVTVRGAAPGSAVWLQPGFEARYLRDVDLAGGHVADPDADRASHCAPTRGTLPSVDDLRQFYFLAEHGHGERPHKHGDPSARVGDGQP